MLRSIYIAKIIRLSLYVIVFEQPKTSGKNSLSECFEGKWCENGCEQNKKKFIVQKKTPII